MAPKEKDICIAFYTQVLMQQACGQLPKELVVFHIANEQRSTVLYTMMLKRMGLLAGVPDYCVLLPRGRVAFIEFKRNAKCKLTPAQEVFKRRCEALGIPYGLYWDVDAALAFVQSQAY